VDEVVLPYDVSGREAHCFPLRWYIFLKFLSRPLLLVQWYVVQWYALDVTDHPMPHTCLTADRPKCGGQAGVTFCAPRCRGIPAGLLRLPDYVVQAGVLAGSPSRSGEDHDCPAKQATTPVGGTFPTPQLFSAASV
jgi:hypothetical protein